MAPLPTSRAQHHYRNRRRSNRRHRSRPSELSLDPQTQKEQNAKHNPKALGSLVSTPVLQRDVSSCFEAASVAQPHISSSNPFSLLDVSIPSPTLETPAFLQYPDDCGTAHNEYQQGSDVSRMLRPLTPPPETYLQEMLRQHNETSPSDKDGVAARSRQPITPPDPPCEGPRVLLPTFRQLYEDGPSGTISNFELAGPDQVYRIPSPLLYHRRSPEILADPAEDGGYQDPQITEQALDYYNFKRTRLTSETRAHEIIYQTFQALHAGFDVYAEWYPDFQDTSHSSYDLKRIGNTSTDSDLQLNGRADCLTKLILPPIVTTTNTFVPVDNNFVTVNLDDALPRKISKRIDYHHKLDVTQNLVFPRLAIPGIGSADFDADPELESQALTVCRPLNKIEAANSSEDQSARSQVSKTSCIRDRADTNDSLDSQFHVATAVRKLVLPIGHVALSSQQKVAVWKVATETYPENEQAQSECNVDGMKTSGVTVQNDYEDDRPKIDEMVDWLLEELSLDFGECFGQESEQDLGKALSATEAVWFDYHANPNDLESTPSIIEVDPHDAETDTDDSACSEDEWETVTSSSVQENEEQSGSLL